MFTPPVADRLASSVMLLVMAVLIGCGCSQRQGDAVVSAAAPSATDSMVSSDDTLRLLFTGDVLLDRGVRPYIQSRGIGWLFQQVSGAFAQADDVIINLECPLADTLTPLCKRYIFHADTRWAADLHQAGITHAALANNHSNDQGYQGLLSTYRTLRAAGIVPLGIGHNTAERLTPVLISKGQTRVALFNAVLFPLEHWITSDQGAHLQPCQVETETLAKAIHLYKASHPHDVVIAVLHWGIEFQTSPTPQQRQEARMLTAAGADAIIGHHPHVIQPMFHINNKPVFFSLGNFVFDQSAPQAQRGQMAWLNIIGDHISCQAEPIDIIMNRPQPSR